MEYVFSWENNQTLISKIIKNQLERIIYSEVLNQISNYVYRLKNSEPEPWAWTLEVSLILSLKF
jgi:hypothetical protein